MTQEIRRFTIPAEDLFLVLRTQVRWITDSSSRRSYTSDLRGHPNTCVDDCKGKHTHTHTHRHT